jgi:hypothetical protein
MKKERFLVFGFWIAWAFNRKEPRFGGAKDFTQRRKEGKDAEMWRESFCAWSFLGRAGHQGCSC